MIQLYTLKEFNEAKSRDKLPLKCKCCGKTFFLGKHVIQSIIIKKYKQKGDFCSKKCGRIFKNPPILVKCEQCGKEVKIITSQIKKFKHHFCSQSCSCTYRNLHKTKGTKVSKLEKWLQGKLPSLYPNHEFCFNRKDAINSELDIYIPSLKLAFELNGIFHYEPIYGSEKLSKTQNNDHRKTIACYERGIELCIIDTSHQKYFKEQTCLQFLKIIQEIISLKISRVAGNPIPETT